MTTSKIKKINNCAIANLILPGSETEIRPVGNIKIDSIDPRNIKHIPR